MKYESLQHFMNEELQIQLYKSKAKSKMLSLKNILNICVISSAKQNAVIN